MILSWISTHAVALGIIATAIATLTPIYKYILIRRSEDRKHTFEAYHRLIGDLVDPPTPRLDRQIAVVYELRNFKDYYPVTLRILNGVKDAWNKNPTGDMCRINKEIDLTIKFIEKINPNSENG